MDLFQSIENVKGIGPKTTEILQKAGIFTLHDLLYYLPRTYENYQSATKIADLRPGKVVIRGKIKELAVNRTRRRNFTITEGIISDNSGSVRAVWFNQPYRAKQFDKNKEYCFSGVYDFSYGRYQLVSPSSVVASDMPTSSNFLPVYPAKYTIKPHFFNKIMQNLRTSFAAIPDLLPSEVVDEKMVKIRNRAEALFAVHFPENEADVDRGRTYFAYEELFELILAAKLNKKENSKLKSASLPFSAAKTREIVAKLPFKLTNAQRIATWDILQDLEKTTPMNRLLQGDVGSGKTVVAALAAYQAISSGKQAALLAPTAILATQHAESLDTLLRPFGVHVGLLTGSSKYKDVLKRHISSGEIDLVVGTHAILTDDTRFHDLALCIIDEQHRFGVAQRQKLLLKNSNTDTVPHLLTMTATPIPRSLQLSIFGDLDVSILNELPKGRQPIETKIMPEVNLREDLYPKVKQTIAEGQQVYWICKVIEDSDDAISVKKQAKKLEKVFPDMEISFLHGRMKPAEKDQIMGDFAAGKIDILVSTTVVEVGVNVPNATIMVIMNAENYGLAQLHQLRGRVGRGDKKSYCYLIVDGDKNPSRRLRELEKSTDGFYLAEKDLELRGPGEIYGSLQHGALNLKIATLADTKLIAAASKQAEAFAKNTENMVKYEELAKNIKKYQQLTTLN
ncbi:ATP-dependent DNA helicase RecG [Candidatus Saccharibacteria bacterium]|nr:ATP-dependent DNA helicase RecG [Candidatus Saccharibacteria bacterium]